MGLEVWLPGLQLFVLMDQVARQQPGIATSILVAPADSFTIIAEPIAVDDIDLMTLSMHQGRYVKVVDPGGFNGYGAKDYLRKLLCIAYGLLK